MFGMLNMIGTRRGTAAGAEAHEVHALPVPNLDLPKPATPGQTRTMVLAGGCFWCTEGAFAQFKGVGDVTSGYAGDTKDNANYQRVCDGDTNHAEAIKITYDPALISY